LWRWLFSKTSTKKERGVIDLKFQYVFLDLRKEKHKLDTFVILFENIFITRPECLSKKEKVGKIG